MLASRGRSSTACKTYTSLVIVPPLRRLFDAHVAPHHGQQPILGVGLCRLSRQIVEYVLIGSAKGVDVGLGGGRPWQFHVVPHTKALHLQRHKAVWDELQHWKLSLMPMATGRGRPHTSLPSAGTQRGQRSCSSESSRWMPTTKLFTCRGAGMSTFTEGGNQGCGGALQPCMRAQSLCWSSACRQG